MLTHRENAAKRGAILAIAGCMIIVPIYGAAQDERGDLAKLLDSPATAKPIVGYKSAWYTEYSAADAKSDIYGIKLCVVEAPGKSVIFSISDTRSTQQIRNVFERATPSSALASINGGFFGHDTKGRPIPLGYIRSKGALVSKRIAWTSGGVLIDVANRAKILPIRSFAPSNERNAVQSKPMLVENGADGIRTAESDKRFDRSAIGLTHSGAVVLAVISNSTGDAANLAEFSYLLTKYKTRSGEAIESALAMDGGPGAHLFVPSLHRHCGEGSVPFVPNIVTWGKRP